MHDYDRRSRVTTSITPVFLHSFARQIRLLLKVKEQAIQNMRRKFPLSDRISLRICSMYLKILKFECLGEVELRMLRWRYGRMLEVSTAIPGQRR